MLDSSKRTIATLTAAACLGAGGWAVAAGAGGSDTASSASQAATQQTLAQPTASTTTNPSGQAPAGPGTSFPGEEVLTGSDAQKATAAATAKVPGATVDRVETDVNNGGTYEAHVTTSDGTRAIVVMDADFTVTDVIDH